MRSLSTGGAERREATGAGGVGRPTVRMGRQGRNGSRAWWARAWGRAVPERGGESVSRAWGLSRFISEGITFRKWPISLTIAW